MILYALHKGSDAWYIIKKDLFKMIAIDMFLMKHNEHYVNVGFQPFKKKPLIVKDLPPDAQERWYDTITKRTKIIYQADTLEEIMDVFLEENFEIFL